MEINEYARTKCGIAQYKEYETSKGKLLCMPLINGVFANIEDIIKHSKDIIDLIEVGDYVNGYLIKDIYGKGEGFDEITLSPEMDECSYTTIKNEDIKEVLTKEQFEANAYTIEKER